MQINETAIKQHAWLAEVGWLGKTTPLEDLALICSEIGEAANECRGEKPTSALGSELADIVLRTMGLAVKEGIDLEAEIAAKMKINFARGTRGRIK